MRQRLHYESNGQGWLLELKQFYDPDTLNPALNPVIMIPGYAMNTFILSYHPTRPSFVEFLVAKGFEVWTANLRGQGGSKSTGGKRDYGFKELSLVDLPAVFDYVARHQRAELKSPHAVGCSLGATFLYTYLAHHADSHGLASLTAMGGPLRWDSAHPLVKLAFRSPGLAGIVDVRGTRRAARAILPLAKRIPKALDIYMNTDFIDLSRASELVKTVDDPVPYLNKQIAHWVNAKDLKVAGLNITQGLASVDLPTLCVIANADGVVPPAAALSVKDAIAGPVDILRVGDERNWFAHADLFINNEAPERVFEPLSQWLELRRK